MKTFRRTTGPFTEQPFFKREQIEQMCGDELLAAGLFPTTPAPVRIDRFLEKRFHVQIEYDALPDGVLGYTEFGARGVQRIVVSRDLEEEGTTSGERRVRTTLAHEGGHGLMHAHLFALRRDTRALFGNEVDPSRPRILCRGEAVAGGSRAPRGSYDGKWWEYQANAAIGALLLPRALVLRCLVDVLKTSGTLGRRVLDAEDRAEAIRLLAETFDVNPAVARIRVEEVFPAADDRQLTL